MFRTKTALKPRASRLTLWRRGDLEIVSRWRQEVRSLLRNPQGDHPRVAVKHLMAGCRHMQMPQAEWMRVYVAKGPIEMHSFLRKLIPIQNPDEAFSTWPRQPIHDYSLGGLVLESVRTFIGISEEWRNPNPIWPQRLFRSSITQTMLAGHVNYNSMWPWVGHFAASTLLGTGLNLQSYKGELNEASHCFLDAIQNCFDCALSSTGAWMVVCRSPKILKVDEYGILHATSGPAVQWEDDLTIYARRGVILPNRFFDGSVTLSRQHINAEGNQEIKSLLIEVYGEERYIANEGFESFAVDERGELFRKAGERTAFVKVRNSSPEPDGVTFRHFYLPVPATFVSPTEAIGWTFQKRRGEYAPIHES